MRKSLKNWFARKEINWNEKDLEFFAEMQDCNVPLVNEDLIEERFKILYTH